MSAGSRSKPREILRERRNQQHKCWNFLIVAPLWVSYEANLGTLLRTCDAVGACMAVPDTSFYRDCLDKGDTLRHRSHIHWVKPGKLSWLQEQREDSKIYAVELADDAIPLPILEPAKERTVLLLGHERQGVPDEAWEYLDQCIQIPMIGEGASLNVAVAGSLVLYRLAGLF